MQIISGRDRWKLAVSLTLLILKQINDIPHKVVVILRQLTAHFPTQMN